MGSIRTWKAGRFRWMGHLLEWSASRMPPGHFQPEQSQQRTSQWRWPKLLQHQGETCCSHMHQHTCGSVSPNHVSTTATPVVVCLHAPHLAMFAAQNRWFMEPWYITQPCMLRRRLSLPHGGFCQACAQHGHSLILWRWLRAVITDVYLHWLYRPAAGPAAAPTGNKDLDEEQQRKLQAMQERLQAWQQQQQQQQQQQL